MVKQRPSGEVVRVPWWILAAICACAATICSPAHAQTQPQLQITSPADGTVVHPGDTVAVVVTPAVGATFQEVALLPQGSLVTDPEVIATPPYDFSVQVPSTAPPGKYGLIALGVVAPGQPSYSTPVVLDVEPSVAISSIRIAPQSIIFDHAGEQIPLRVVGTFADGTVMDITHSSAITYTSGSTSVATVTPYGVVKAVGTGCTDCAGLATIQVSFGGKTALVQVSTSALKDATPPTTTATLSPTPNAAGWNDSDVTVTLDATDAGTNPSGVQQISYSASGAQTIASANVTGSTASFTVSTEGTTTITYSATDNAGNVEAAQTLVVKLDKTPPVVNCGAADSQWHAANVSIACTATDALSGLAQSSQASFSLTTSVPQGTETTDASTGSLPVCDAAGNCATAGPITGNMVDLKAPTISITTPASGDPTYLLNQAVAANYSCTDGGSGVATCSGTVPNGNDLNTASVGTENFTVNATDKVGNASNLSAGYSVSYNICVLYDQTKAVESNATIPIRFYLCDANQGDVSASSIAVNFVGVQQISTTTSGVVVTYPAATPDANFRFSSDLGPSGGYIMNLSTKGYAAGTYQLTFTVANDPKPHSVQFEVSQ